MTAVKDLSLAETREKMIALSDQLDEIFQQAGPEMNMNQVSAISGDSAYKAGEIKRLNAELADLGQHKDQLELLEAIGKNNAAERRRMTEPVSGMAHPTSGGAQANFNPRDLKRFIFEHRAYKEFRAGNLRTINLEVPGAHWNTLITLSGVNAPATRLDPVSMALEERTVADLLMQGGMDGNTVEYYEETGFTNNADTVAEGAEKPESAIVWTLRTEHARKIAHWIPASKEALDDVSFLESTIRNRLRFGVQRKEEAQILHGDGVGENLLGILNRSIQSQAKGADPTPDAIYKGMQKVRGADGSGFSEPSAVIFHPNNWTPIRLLRTSDGIYIWGNPSDAGPDRIWGLMVRQTTEMPLGTALTGAFSSQAEVLRREGVNITLSTEHSDFFIKNKVAILGESRLGLAVYRPSAFAEITGLPSA